MAWGWGKGAGEQSLARKLYRRLACQQFRAGGRDFAHAHVGVEGPVQLDQYAQAQQAQQAQRSPGDTARPIEPRHADNRPAAPPESVGSLSW